MDVYKPCQFVVQYLALGTLLCKNNQCHPMAVAANQAHPQNSWDAPMAASGIVGDLFCDFSSFNMDYTEHLPLQLHEEL